MTVSEIYSSLARHMVKGFMMHEQLSNYFDFLGLQGFKRCQEYHYFEESCNYRSLNRYYLNHHDKLIELGNVEDPHVIPDSWYKYTRHDVDNGTKKNAVKNAFQIWEEWETETKKVYESHFRELMNLGEVASAMKIKEFLCDVDEELKCVQRKVLELKAIDYDLSIIVPMQDEIHDKYKEKLDNMKSNF